MCMCICSGVRMITECSNIKILQLPGLQVRENWYKNVVNANTVNIHNEILDAAPEGNKVFIHF